MRKSLLYILMFVSLFLLTACFSPSDPVITYQGEFQELAATAIYSIPGIKSCLDDQILVLEKDDFGRVLFLAYLKDGILVRDSFADAVLAVVIMQKSDESNVYFYGEKNYLARIVNEQIDFTPSVAAEYFAVEAISKMKETNDWGCPLDDSENHLVIAPNSLEKDNDIQKESMQTLEKKFGDNYRKLLFREDSNGNKIYMIMAIRDDHYQWYMIILDKDGELPSGDGILELDLSALDALSCSIDAFMAQNNWE